MVEERNKPKLEDLEYRIIALEKREKLRELRLDYLALQYKIMKIKNQDELLKSMERKEEEIILDEEAGKINSLEICENEDNEKEEKWKIY